MTDRETVRIRNCRRWKTFIAAKCEIFIQFGNGRKSQQSPERRLISAQKIHKASKSVVLTRLYSTIIFAKILGMVTRWSLGRVWSTGEIRTPSAQTIRPRKTTELRNAWSKLRITASVLYSRITRDETSHSRDLRLGIWKNSINATLDTPQFMLHASCVRKRS